MVPAGAALSVRKTRNAPATREACHPDPDRETVVQEFLPGIRIHAAKLKQRIPPHIDIDDLVSSGVVGLLDAVDRYDNSRGTQFKTYAEFRIRGAMLDYLREMDWFPRTARQDANRLQQAYSRLESTLGRTPEESDVADELEITVAELRKRLAMLAGLTVFSLDEIENEDDESCAGWRRILAEAALDETREVELTRELKEILGKAIDTLPDREKQVIAFYYFEDLNLREISGIVGLGEPRICQLHAQAVLRLKGKISRQFS